MRRRATAAALSAALLLAAAPGRADLPANGAQIQTSRYSVDMTQGPVLAGTRVMGLAGAYVALAEGTEGNTQNPAAPAVRTPWSVDNLDYDLGFGLTFPSTVENTDFFNTGQRTTQLGNTDTTGFVFLDLSGNLQFGAWGVGLTLNMQQYGVTRRGSPEKLNARFITGHGLVARSLADGQLVLGGGVRLSNLTLVNGNPLPNQSNSLFETTGTALELGALIRPNWRHFRIGAALRSAVTTHANPTSKVNEVNGDHIAGTPGSPDAIFLPDHVALPWDVNVGAAIQIGPRPFNPRWLDPDEVVAQTKRYLDWRARERERRRAYLLDKAKQEGRDVDAAAKAIDAENATQAALDKEHLRRVGERVRKELKARAKAMARFYVLLSAQLLITGPLPNAVGVESFLEQKVNRSGQRATYSPRAALETELIPGWLKIRGGAYFEPTRFASSKGRWHGTGGLGLKLFPWSIFGLFDDDTVWRASGAIDASARYFGWSASVGVWH